MSILKRVGKTTVESMLSNYIHSAPDYSVIVIDADPQKSFTRMRKLDLSKGHEEENLFNIVTIPAIDVEKKIKNIVPEYDLIFIDLPGDLYEAGVMNCYKLAYHVFVPTNVTTQDLTATNDLSKAASRILHPYGERTIWRSAL